MLRSFVVDDIYRVMLGCEAIEPLARTLGEHGLRSEGPMRQMHRDDGSSVWVSVVLVDGDTLEQIALHAALMLMQIDNISARLRATPALPGGGERAPRYAPARQRYGVAA